MNRAIFSEAPWLLLLLQGTACIAAGLAMSYLLRRRAAQAHQTLLAGLLLSVFMPGLYLTVGHFGLGILASETPASLPRETSASKVSISDVLILPPALEQDPSPIASDLMEPPPIHAPETGPAIRMPWRQVVLGGWCLATTLLACRLLIRFLLGLRLVHTSQPLEEGRLVHAARQATGGLGIEGPVRIRWNRRLHSPVIWCWALRPVLLVHAGALREGRADWTAVFCHELAHWKRRDHLTGLFAEVLVVLFPWHPLLWWAGRRLVKLSERVCDDWALAGGTAGVDYAESLLDLTPEAQMSLLPTVVGKEKAMKERIRRIVKDGCGDPRIGTRWAVLVSGLAVLLAVGAAFAQRRPAERPMREQAEREELREQQEQREIAAAARRAAVERMREQLVGQIREREMLLRERGEDLGPEDRNVLQFELELLHEQMGQLDRRLRSFEPGEPPRREPSGEEAARRRDREVGEVLDGLRAHRDELARRAGAIEREIAGLRDNQDEEARDLRNEFREIGENIGQIEREMANVEREHRWDNLRQSGGGRLRDLRARADGIRRELEGIDDKDSPEARELRAQLERTHAEMAEIEMNLRQLEREQAERRRPRSDMPEELRRDLMRRREQLMAQIPRVEGELREREERGEGRDDAAQELRMRLDGMHQQMREIEMRLQGEPERRRPADEEPREDPLRRRIEVERSESRRDIPMDREAPDNRTLRMEVEELRGQVDGLREQMQQMRELLEQIAGGRQTGNAEGSADRVQELGIQY